MKLKKNTDHDHNKHITSQEFHKLTSDSFTARPGHPNLAYKNYIVALVKTTFTKKFTYKSYFKLNNTCTGWK